MNKIILIPLLAIVLLLIDIYVYQAVKLLVQNATPYWRLTIKVIYWGVTLVTLTGFFIYHFTNPDYYSRIVRNFLMVGIFINYFSKSFAMVFLMLEDVTRAVRWVVQTVSSWGAESKSGGGTSISRSEFLAKSALIAGAVPLVSMSYGIISGAHDYRIRRKTVHLPNLPKAWDGIRIAQVSDIHSGSFWNKVAVQGGVDMLLKEKPDMIFFTGDLVNNEADEMKNYFPIFKQLKAPLGVYSILGNHDYGDYKSWPSQQAKEQNLNTLKQVHKEMGWRLLLNENEVITVDKEPLAILGVENWGAGRFAKYGKLDEAYAGTKEIPVKLLLSHDPSHWDAQVRKDYKDIDMMFAGHTHGFQFGVELGDFKWSPSQYVYKQWAGHYQQENQHLYVNRGYGYLGYPGRIGIPPEITMIELKTELAQKA